ncbi:MAG: MBL fold metallo-hydrolase [Candidatus Omnitrophota bacterium]
MKVSWLGHACFLLETDQGTRLITDPYESGGYAGAVGYGPISLKADIVTVSHQHTDHNHIGEFKTAQVVDKKGKFKIKDFEIQGIPSYHDKEKGKERGPNIIFAIQADGLKIIHCGDLGTKDIDLTPFFDIDIAFIPVGGVFTIGAQEASDFLRQIVPKITIPMHFKTSKLGFDIDRVEKFLNLNPDYEKRVSLDISPQNRDSFKQIVVLEHQR